MLINTTKNQKSIPHRLKYQSKCREDASVGNARGTESGMVCVSGCDASTFTVHTCNMCPRDSFSSNGTSDENESTCNVRYRRNIEKNTRDSCIPGTCEQERGHGDINGSLCTSRTYSIFSSATSIETCMQCPVSSFSSMGSSDISPCKCVPGTTGYDGGGCTCVYRDSVPIKHVLYRGVVCFGIVIVCLVLLGIQVYHQDTRRIWVPAMPAR